MPYQHYLDSEGEKPVLDLAATLAKENCCICGETLIEKGEGVNFLATQYQPDWKYPTMGNFQLEQVPVAVAIVCDECIADCMKKQQNEEPFDIPHVVEIITHGGISYEIIYHKTENLKKIETS